MVSLFSSRPAVGKPPFLQGSLCLGINTIAASQMTASIRDIKGVTGIALGDSCHASVTPHHIFTCRHVPKKVPQMPSRGILHSTMPSQAMLVPAGTLHEALCQALITSWDGSQA
ncbi:hypothetical protein SKAU_G00231900 [Synaphobranchus kaupii]|uniref:Uncharacterized protein n=1 Tax=Synaphobranchus kaupii TaxID=118154 RepID=A0A9Q1ITC3_SYNKA|nr:hypothetical protein SKAU_G00231900 [Synaphobranchus kaupii]